MAQQKFKIRKAGGFSEFFNQNKLSRSLRKSGLDGKIAQDVAGKIAAKVKPNISSENLYRLTLGELEKKDRILASRYRLKRALMGLGPSGYTFEKYFAAVLEHYNYRTKTNQLVWGKCVRHEVDIIALKNNRHAVVECKYHNRPGLKSDIKVALYTFARFLDIRQAWEEARADAHLYHEVWLVTNTKVTGDAAAYARCKGITVISWGYPEEKNLQKIIESRALYPINILSGLNSRQIRIMLENNVVLIADILEESKMGPVLRQAKISDKLWLALKEEAEALLAFAGQDMVK